LDKNPLQLPTSSEIVSAFVKDLSNVAALFSAGGEKPTRTIVFTSSTTAIQAWRADGDYFIVAVTANTASVQVLSLDATPATILQAVDRVNSAPNVVVAQSFTGLVFGLRHPIKAGDKLYWAPAASGEFCNVVLQYA
jgi:ABC-type xylose transport system substrate-binding protein